MQNLFLVSTKNFLMASFFMIALALLMGSCEESTHQESRQNKDQTQSFEEQIEAVGDLQSIQDPSFTIEADYDPSLSEKISKSKNKEPQRPIATTSDDDDLDRDSDDLPEALAADRNAVAAYDYKPEQNMGFAENTAKGGEATPTSTPATTNNPKVKPSDEIYLVVGGAFRDEKSAQSKLKKLEAAGYKPEIISMDSEFKTVCIAKLNDKVEAEALVKKIMEEHKLDVYVVKRRQ